MHWDRRISGKLHPRSPPSCWVFPFLPGSGVEEGVPLKTPRGRSGRIRGYAVFPLSDFGEVTAEVSGTQGPRKEVAPAIGSAVVWPWAAKLSSYLGGLGSATIFKTWPSSSVLGAALLMAPGLLPWNLLLGSKCEESPRRPGFSSEENCM